ncbi:hypothetical protein G9A89_022829 [Geosiphon pyriformis]|nr:hypothetical protein G9A89_022829 [Geosiphon pyriformis]
MILDWDPNSAEPVPELPAEELTGSITTKLETLKEITKENKGEGEKKKPNLQQYKCSHYEEHFEAHNKNNLDFIKLNSLLSYLICFSIEEQSSRQFQDFWNWFLNKHSAKIYTAYTTYYFDQTYFKDNFKERNNNIN